MIRRTLNWKVLVLTVVLAGASAWSLSKLHAWQLNRTAKGLLDLAAAQEEESDWFKAADYLDRYLRVHAGDTEVRVRLARTYGKGAEPLMPSQGDREKERVIERAIDLHYRALATGLPDEEAASLRTVLAELLL